MKLFVTGAAGFVGASVVRVAVAEGHEVLAAVRSIGVPKRIADLADRVTLVPLELRNREHVAQTVVHHRPDAIIHAAWAGVGNKARFERLQITDNVEAACSLVDAAIESGARKFVGIGSQGEYGPLNRRISETELPQPTTLYGAAKLSAFYLTQQLAAQAELPYAWLRLFSTYGPQDNDGWLIPMLIDEMLAGRRPQCTLGTQFWDYLYIEDLARGIVASATSQATGVMNIGSGSPVQVRHIVETIRDIVAPDMELIFGEVPFRPDQVMHMEANIDKLIAASGWRPTTDIKHGLQKTIDWHKVRDTN